LILSLSPFGDLLRDSHPSIVYQLTMNLANDIDEWLDSCPTDTEIMHEFDNSIWVQVSHPWEEEKDKEEEFDVLGS